MTAKSNHQFTVEQFNGRGSFTLWQRRVKDILVQQGLAKALKGKDGKPKDMIESEWEELESRCVSTIRLCIADNIINNVMDEDSAPAIWEKLEKLYLAKSLTNKLHLKRQLYRLKMEEGGNLMEHLSVFNGIIDQLKKVDVKIEEEDKALLLLTSLPDSYENLVTTLLYGKDTVNLDQVQAVLLSHETQRKSNQEEGHDSALVTRGEHRRGRSTDRRSESSRSGSRVSGKGIQCYKCREFGHVKRDCPLKKKDDASNGNALAFVDDDGDVFTVSKGFDTFLMILDFACGLHVYSGEEYFDMFQGEGLV